MIDKSNATIEILNDIIGQTENDEEIIHILKGAHVQFIDNNFFYNFWTPRYKDFLTTENCSHNSTNQYYRIRSVLVPEILFGTSKKGTWVQLENHSGAPEDFLLHFIDYMRYVISGKNRGPFGSSTYIDKNPLIIKRKTPRKSIKRIKRIKSNKIARRHIESFGKELVNVIKDKKHKIYIKKRINSRLKNTKK